MSDMMEIKKMFYLQLMRFRDTDFVDWLATLSPFRRYDSSILNGLIERKKLNAKMRIRLNGN
jgi:hypothetical protein